jgi:dolichyl-phosphate-mannose--protein O-mannosyl transferase
MRKWRLTDSILLGLIVLLAAGVRMVALGSPDRLVFDESYYVQDACTYLHLGSTVCGGVTESSWGHPPLGKWLIALGIAIGGYEPAAWRAPSAVAGVVMVAALYVLALRVTRSSLGAGLASAFLALDPLSIVTSRVGMLDIFVACAGVLAVTFAVLHRDSIAARSGGRRRFAWWLLACGVSCGVAVATKWSGVLVLATVGLLTVAWEVDARRLIGGWQHRARAIAPLLLVCFVLVPLAIYVASYIGRLEAVVLAPPWQQDAWPRVFGGQQLRMATFHAGLEATHPYASPAWSWPLGKRAVPYFFASEDGRYREILAFADLVLWLPALAAAAWAAVRFARQRQIWGAEFVVAATVAGSYLPWLILTLGRSFVFLHYFVPVIPFLGLALGWAVTALPRRVGRAAAGIAATAAIVVYLFWAPLVYGWTLPYDQWRMRILFTDCTPQEVVDDHFVPRPRGGPPPAGWCWV